MRQSDSNRYTEHRKYKRNFVQEVHAEIFLLRSLICHFLFPELCVHSNTMFGLIDCIRPSEYGHITACLMDDYSKVTSLPKGGGNSLLKK